MKLGDVLIRLCGQHNRYPGNLKVSYSQDPFNNFGDKSVLLSVESQSPSLGFLYQIPFTDYSIKASKSYQQIACFL